MEAKKRKEEDEESSGSSDDYSDDEQEGEADYRVGGYHRVQVRTVAVPLPPVRRERSTTAAAGLVSPSTT